jgi:PKD repeat protein
LASSTGIISGTPAAAGIFTFTVSATNAGGSNSKSLSLTVNTPPGITTTSPLPGALTGSVYTQTLAATGTAPITWSVTSGALPAGLSLASSTGIISGTPTAAGIFTFTVSATNAGGSNSKSLSLTVNTPPGITTTSYTAFKGTYGRLQALEACGITRE